jgi:hypothetical protein
MDAKKLAIVLGIAALLPLFLALFMEAVYPTPEYNDYCNDSYYMSKPMPAVQKVNCTEFYSTPESIDCSNQGGNPQTKYDENGCMVFDTCDFCNKQYNDATKTYNDESLIIFIILAILGLIAVIIGIYLPIDYIGAGLMFGGMITMFYATIRYFGSLSKILRALVIFVELLIIMWIAYKKIGDGKEKIEIKAVNKKSKEKKRK